MLASHADPNRPTGRTLRQLTACLDVATGGGSALFIAGTRGMADHCIDLLGQAGVDRIPGARLNQSHGTVTIGSGRLLIAIADRNCLLRLRGSRFDKLDIDHAARLDVATLDAVEYLLPLSR